MTKSNAKAYWKENIRYVLILLAVWFLVSYGAGIMFKDALNEIRIGGFKLGFWFAQQGSMYVFVVLIFVYVRLMNKLDKKYGYDYYALKVMISKKELEIAKQKNMKLFPGMPAEIYVLTEPRTPLSYLISPITASLDKAFIDS